MYGSGPTINDVYTSLQKDIREQILREKDEVILHTDTDELERYYFEDRGFSPIEFDPNKVPSFDYIKEIRNVPAQQREEYFQRGGDISFEYEKIIVSLPILPNEKVHNILRFQSSTFFSSGEPEVSVGNDTLTFSLDIKGYGFKYDEDQAAAEVAQKISLVKRWIGFKNNDINRDAVTLQAFIKSFVLERKAQLGEDAKRLATLVQKINIPLKQKENEAVTRIKLDTKPLVKKAKPNPKLPEEYALDQSKVLDIISVIDNQGRQFEKTAKTYKIFPEEGLRDVILVSLNSLFDGKATGETFSYSGKTDIYLNIDKGNILICECKIWGGQALYLKTIDQLLGYLTWRHNFGIMITFVRQKNFSKILVDAPGVIQSHSSYLSGFRKVSETHFLSRHKLGADEDKDVEIHHLFYNLFSEE